MKLKGTAKITLKDTATGKIVHTEEHTNTITPALARIFGSDIAGTLNYAKLTPVFSKLLGGVCLFNGTLDNTKVFLPKASSAQLTAHAGQTPYTVSTDDPKRGNPVGTSGPVANGYKFVWEWVQNGNGTVTDLVLTHSDTGDFWNESTPNSMSSFSPIEDVSNGIISPSGFGWTDTGVQFGHIVGLEKIPVAFLTDTNHVITLETTENTIIVRKAKFTGSGAWIWNNIADIEVEQEIIFEPTPWQQGTFENFGIGCFYVAVYNNKLYAIACGRTDGTIYHPYNQLMTINILDLETGTATNRTVDCSATLDAFTEYERIDGEALPTGATFSMFAVNEERGLNQLQVVDGSVFIPVFWGNYNYGGLTDCSIRVSLSDSSDQEIIKKFYNNMQGNYSVDYSQIDLGNDRIMNPCSYAYKSGNQYIGQEIARNMDVYPTNNRQTRAYCAKMPSESPVQYFTYADNMDAVRGCILNKLYQATVYHLETPVVKTANLTMTVEYTITQVAEA